MEEKKEEVKEEDDIEVSLAYFLSHLNHQALQVTAATSQPSPTTSTSIEMQ